MMPSRRKRLSLFRLLPARIVSGSLMLLLSAVVAFAQEQGTVEPPQKENQATEAASSIQGEPAKAEATTTADAAPATTASATSATTADAAASTPSADSAAPAEQPMIREYATP